MAEQNQYAGFSEFLATGGSLYYLRHRNLIEGSEQVKIDVRDKNTGMTIYSITQEQNTDYEMKYDEGRIMFKKPVLSVATSDTLISDSILEGNPVYIVVKYEYKSQEAFPIILEDLDKKTGGIRVSRALGNHIQIGATYVQESKTGENHKLLGEDVTIKIGNFTKVEAEFAKTESQTIPGYFSYNGGFDFTEFSQDTEAKSDARHFRLNSSLGEYLGLGKDCLEVSWYFKSIGRNFSSTDSLFEAGTEKTGLELAHKLTENDRVRFLAQREEIIEGVKVASDTGIYAITDSDGKYHFSYIETGQHLLKVDPVTLPEGATFTTDNPYKITVTKGILTKVSFGVKLPERDNEITKERDNGPLLKVSITQDPVMLKPKLAVSTTQDKDQIIFKIDCNYRLFIEKAKLAIYNQNYKNIMTIDLSKPIPSKYTLPIKDLSTKQDTYYYQLCVYDKQNREDRTGVGSFKVE